ncbi:MAG: hydantoinase/oxoprolinase family protein [Desulfocapsaceae bacterium]|nr:hydantoinase/oxoprolinase family protein [Desulfocapsaceae bacterium]
MQKYFIGIDTGGTCTDAVLMESATGKVVETAKEPTTHHRLSIGTANALKSLFTKADISPGQVRAVAVSSTLATNSIVENKGARVALLVIGYVKHFRLPVKAVVFIKGGHTITGKEEEPLDIEYLVDIVGGLRQEVDAYGVCSAMSIENPTHELVAEKAISMIDPKPVFCSHRISQQAGMQERAATAGLHAKLMPLMQEYVTGVREAMTEQRLDCPMVIVGGNGKIVSSTEAVQQAGVTVASGPACTASFGAHQSGSDSLIIDIGGTTTDMAIIENGRPSLSPDGCTIGDWKTHVEAVDMHTGGIGGDSHVLIDEKGNMTIGPARVVPLAMSTGFPDLSQWLGPSSASRCVRLVAVQRGEPKMAPILEALQAHGPATPRRLRDATGLSGIPLDTQLEDLARKQLIVETGFTPTDALHVLGRIDLGDRKASLAGATILGGLMGKGPEEFCTLVVAKTGEMIENLIIEYIFTRTWGKTLTNFISTRRSHPILGVDFSLKIPLIGIGAAARFFLPGVAARLATTVSFPENYAVGNAIGAAMICRQELLPASQDKKNEDRDDEG